jgi:hypothetical protein
MLINDLILADYDFVARRLPDGTADPFLPLGVRNIRLVFYPVKVSTNNRYLVDQNNAPFLIMGDCPQSGEPVNNSNSAGV